jgi:predicted nuclease of restriction endonuclease-like (RecB) superfamily
MSNIHIHNDILFSEIKNLINESRLMVAQTVNSALTATYWNIGKKINNELLKNKRAEYGKQIVATLSRQLTLEYGNNFDAKNLRRMMQFHAVFPDFENVATVWRQLSWSHFKLLIPLKNDIERDFYTQMCRVEKWSVRILHKKIDSMLFERTAISRKPEELAKLELKQLKESDRYTPDLVFRDPYVLDFLNLKDTYLEKDFELAIIRELENFILELGVGFSFVARQKRMIIDGKDFTLDLLFYHRKLRRLVAIELKIGEFKAEYKGKMELYLRWLEKYETEANEEQPIGLILCAEGNHEQIELLQLDRTNIKVAEFITKVLPKKVLAEKLHHAIEIAKNRIDT